MDLDRPIPCAPEEEANAAAAQVTPRKACASRARSAALLVRGSAAADRASKRRRPLQGKQTQPTRRVGLRGEAARAPPKPRGRVGA